MVKCLPEFEYFYWVLKNRNIISKIRGSKITDYAALILVVWFTKIFDMHEEKQQIKHSFCFTFDSLINDTLIITSHTSKCSIGILVIFHQELFTH